VKRLMMFFVLIMMSVGAEAAAMLQVGPANGRLFIDANTEPDVDRYWLYRADVACTDPTPTPTNCPMYARIGVETPQAPDPVVLTDPGVHVCSGVFLRCYGAEYVRQ